MNAHRSLTHPSRTTRRRPGTSLVEVVIAIVILSGTMLGLANFGRKFQHTASTAGVQALASDLATQRLEVIRGYRAYTSIVSAYDATTETFADDPVYSGFTRTTAAVRCTGCPTATNDYITVTVTVTGNSLTAAVNKTTIIAVF